MNMVGITGRLTKDLVLRKSTNGKSYVYFTVAISSINEQTDFISCVAWNKVAENMEQFLIKGSLVSVSGRLATRKSNEQYITEVVANTVTFLDNRKKEVSNYKKDYKSEDKKINVDDAFKRSEYSTDINSIKLTPSVEPSFEDNDDAIIWDE